MNRLKELREFHDLTQQQCARIAYISKKSYIRYETGERVIPLDTAIYYAEYYGVSLDYIAGITNEPARFAPPSDQEKMREISHRIEINPSLFSALKKLSERQQKGLADIINLLSK